MQGHAYLKVAQQGVVLLLQFYRHEQFERGCESLRVPSL